MRWNVTVNLWKPLGIMPYHTVARWVGKFQQGRVSTSDEQRSGRPFSVRTDLSRAVIKTFMDEDRRSRNAQQTHRHINFMSTVCHSFAL
ncbi:hypothetical protein TNCT_94451 [Trichonephila clavata]|uniref:Transposase n=1 Tax=Trichonephila clavata TaxID=2740835 RepID=A0A8X6HJR3_TRICU|nr:hypothetical protein TNCT_94451 [Trichonephila clavata]